MNKTLISVAHLPRIVNSYTYNNCRSVFRNKRVLTYSWILLSGLVAYFSVFQNKFQSKWDDQWVVINEYTSSGFTFDNVRSILVEYYHGQYAPVNQLYYTLLHSFAGYNPIAFHAASLLIHLINSCLVYLLLTKLLALFCKDDLQKNKIYPLAFLSSIIFVIHPVNSEAVAWISASKILVYSFFYLLALIIYVGHVRQPRNINYLYIFVLSILSFAGKEQAVTFPVCMVLIDYFAGHKMSDKGFWIKKIPFFVLSLFFCWVTLESQAAVGSGLLTASEEYPFFQRIVFASYCIIEYATKCVLPIKLSYIYPFPNVIGEQLPLRFYFYPIALGALISFGWKACKEPIVLFGILFFIIHISLLLHLIPISRFAITADRYVYISSIMGCLCVSFLYVFLKNKIDKGKYLFNISMLFYLISLFCYTNARVRVWKDSITLKREFKIILNSRLDLLELKSRKSK